MLYKLNTDFNGTIDSNDINITIVDGFEDYYTHEDEDTFLFI